MDEKTEIIQKCVETLHEAGIDAKLVRMYGASKSDAIITLPEYKVDDNEQEKAGVSL